MRRLAYIFLAGFLLPGSALSQTSIQGDGAILRSLDTITGRVMDLIMEVGQSTEFEHFEIALEECRFLPENPVKFSYAYVTVTDQRNQSALYSAWMISHSPAVSAFEHPRFDFWLIRCTTLAPEISKGMEEN